MKSKYYVTIDLETSGLDSRTDRIIQIGMMKVEWETKKIVEEYSTLVRPTGEWKMSIGAYIKHGIKPSDLEGHPTFPEISKDVMTFIDGCDIVTYNGIHCDIPFLVEEFARGGIEWDSMKVDIYDCCIEENERNSNRLEKVFERYTGHTMEDAGYTAHDALSDVKATNEVFLHQMEEKEFGPVERLCPDDFIKNMEVTINGKTITTPCFASGKYKFTPVKLVCKMDVKYITWCLSSNLSSGTKDLIRSFFPKK